MPASPSGRTVLVVEDEYFVALSIVRALQESGFTVTGPVPSVEAALAALDRGLPDLALLDANLRGRSAAPIAERLAAGRVPYAIVTGYSGPLADHDLPERTPRLSKPFTPAQIANLAAHLLAAGREDRGSC